MATDWMAEARRVLTLPAPRTITETELRERQLRIILAEIVKEHDR